MPRDFLMSWDGRNDRWFKRTPKKYLTVAEAKVVKVSCRQLGAASSKTASYRAANEWWRRKEAEWEAKLNTDSTSAFPREVDDADLLEQMASWLRSNGEEGEAQKKMEIAQRIRNAAKKGERPNYSDREVFSLSDWDVEDDADFLARYVSDVDVWSDRLDRQKPIPSDKAIRTWVDAFIEVLRPKTKPQSLPNIVRQLKAFTDFHGETASVESIDRTIVRSVYLHLHENGKADSTNRDIWSTWKRWVEFLAEEEQIVRPSNLNSRELTFSVSHVAKAPELAEIVSFVKKLTDERIKLYALLCLNCGMNNADIGQLHNTNYGWKQSQTLLEQRRSDCGHVDWQEGRIVRQRQKTKGKGKVPTVCYKLWPTTFDLLVKYRSDDERFCLLTESGTPLWKRDSKRKDDVYGRKWKALKSLTPKELRAGGATVLGNHEAFRLYISHYLADSPRGIPDRHYVVPSQQQFDAAIDWLGRQIKQV